MYIFAETNDIKNRVGPPVEGDDFIGREKELEFAFDLIEDGNSLILAAPRRIGKTSFAKKTLSFAKAKGWRTLEINLEGIDSEIKFIKTFVKELEKITKFKAISSQFKKKLTELLDQIEVSLEKDEFKGSVRISRTNKELLDKLEDLLDHSKNTIIFIDELGVLLNSYKNDKEIGVARAEKVLNWFRSLRQKSNNKIRWIFCSSIGIRNFANQHNISYTINDLEPLYLKAFDEKTAKDLIIKLANTKRLTFSEEVIQEMLNKLEWFLPYFIQILFKEIHKEHHINNHPINREVVELAYNNLTKQSYLNTWSERLNYYVHEGKAREILKHISRNPRGEKRSNLINKLHEPHNEIEITKEQVANLLKMLENDGYLFQNTKGSFIFRSPFLRDYWYNKFIK